MKSRNLPVELLHVYNQNSSYNLLSDGCILEKIDNGHGKIDGEYELEILRVKLI